MDYALDDRQREFQRNLRALCEGKIRDSSEQVESRGEVPMDHLRVLAEVGFLGLLIPEDYGGNGEDMICALLGMEELARVCPSTALVAGTTLLRFGVPLLRFGSSAQKERFLSLLTTGGLKGAWALSEPHGGMDTRNLRTRARMDGEGYVLQGEKSYVLNGPDAHGLLVLTSLEGDASSADGGSAAFVIAPPVAGMEPCREIRAVGARGARVSALRFSGCRLPKEARLGGEEGPGVEELERLPHVSLMVAGYAIGVGQACLESAVCYAKERKTFGRPIVTYQEIHFKIADMHVNVDVARQLALRAAWLVDSGKDASAEASVAKLFASEMAPECARACMQIYGGKGVTQGGPVERLWRDSQIAEVIGGTSESHRLFLAKEVLERRA